MGNDRNRGGRGGGRGNNNGNRGRRGANNSNRGRVNKDRGFNNNSNNDNNNNNHNNSQKYCEFHKWNNTHVTGDCKTGKNVNNEKKNQQNGGRKNKEGGGNSRNNEGNQNQGGNRSYCTRCGFTNHTVQTCSAKILPEEDWCECGCEYHKTSSQCIWNCDEEERLAAVAAATSKICQWCKRDGDGAHSFEDCPLPTKFRRDLKKRIEDTYDSLMWCWHCSSEDHKTRGCVKQNAQLGKDKWNMKITAIIVDWKQENVLNANDRYDFENEEMENGYGESLNTRAPVPHDPRFAWCLFCEDFGHVGPQPVCDRSEYQRRKPTGALDRGIEHPFAPRPLTCANGIKEALAFGEGSSSSGRGTLHSPCIMVGCGNILTFHRVLPALGQVIICPRCRTSNSHPSSSKRGSTSRDIVQLAEFIGNLTGTNPTRRSLKTLLNIPLSPDQEETPEHLRRPSAFIMRNIQQRLPNIQPTYKDTGEKPKGAKGPFFLQDGYYYNEPGNHQNYFPATKIRICVEDLMNAQDDELPINRAGRRGQVPMCASCGVPGNVYDDQNDIVMCGTDPANTLCYGKGGGLWSGYNRRQANWAYKCNCLTDIMGHVPKPVWLAAM